VVASFQTGEPRREGSNAPNQGTRSARPAVRPGTQAPSRWRRLIGWSAAAGVGVAVLGALLLGSRPFDWHSLWLNTAGDVTGAIIMGLAVLPVVRASRERFTAYAQRAVLQASAFELNEFPDPADFLDQIRNANVGVDILDTCSFLMDRRNDAAFRAAVLEGNARTHIRVLLADPGSETARARQEQLPETAFASDLRHNLALLFDLLDHAHNRGGRLQVRLYTIDPAIAYYRTDNLAIMSFYPVSARADEGPQLQVNVFSPIGNMAQQRFDEFWEHKSVLLYTCTVVIESGHTFQEIGFLDAPDGARYLATRDEHLIRALVGRDRLQAGFPGETGLTEYSFKSLEESSPRFSGIYDEVEAKYGAGARVVLELSPLAPLALNSAPDSASDDA